MRRVRYHEYGGPEVLRVEEADVPGPGPGQLRIRAEAIGANFVDTKLRSGAGGIFTWPLPATLTGDVVGTVDAVGGGVDRTLVGSRVAAMSRDAFADYAVVDANWALPVPDGLDLGAASMLPTAAPVALRVLRSGRLASGETVLIHAAAGAIGHVAVQLARLLGAGTVIATASSPAKLDFAKACGADAGVDYTDAGWAEQVRAAAPDGVDVVLDAIGGQVTSDGIGLLAPFGRLVVYGAASNEIPTVSARDLYELKELVGFSMSAWCAARPDDAKAESAELAGHFASGRLRAAVHATLPLAEAARAHRMLDDRAQLGRILLVP
ncbi:MAG TPA: zinc-binding dehydrogenase [Streptosporangiales bacterium]